MALKEVGDFKENDFVIIKKYKGDDANEWGRICSVDLEKQLLWVSNMNMPFYGVISDWFGPSELERV
jgi:hypothetical protein